MASGRVDVTLVGVGRSASDGAPFGGAVTHGDQLTQAHVGPWALQGVDPGDEVLESLTGPERGFWRFDTPDEFSSSTAWPSDANDSNPEILNDPDLHSGTVTGSAVTIDGYSIPVGTRVVQFREFPDGFDFYAQGSTLKVLFRGCRFRFSEGVGGSSLFNDNTAPSSQRVMMHYGDIGCLSLDPPDGASAFMFYKSLGGSDHRWLRNYQTRTAVFAQPNTPGWEIVENWMGEYIFAYGESGTSGSFDSTVYHLNGISSEGGQTRLKILRNRIICQSPDGATGSTGTSAGQIGYGTQSGQTGYGDGSEPGRLTTQTDCIALFAITASNVGDDTTGIQIKDNLLGGSGVCLYAGNADDGAQNIVVTGNRVTTRYWTDGGNFGAITDIPVWGSDGNEQSDNLWADDYGTGGNGCTAPADREFPAGDGPRAGTSFVA